MKSDLPNSINNLHKISVAPMMDCTDKHFRMIIRKISSRALLYTEMVVAQSLIHTKQKRRFLDFNLEELYLLDDIINSLKNKLPIDVNADMTEKLSLIQAKVLILTAQQ